MAGAEHHVSAQGLRQQPCQRRILAVFRWCFPQLYDAALHAWPDQHPGAGEPRCPARPRGNAEHSAQRRRQLSGTAACRAEPRRAPHPPCAWGSAMERGEEKLDIGGLPVGRPDRHPGGGSMAAGTESTRPRTGAVAWQVAASNGRHHGDVAERLPPDPGALGGDICDAPGRPCFDLADAPKALGQRNLRGFVAHIGGSRHRQLLRVRMVGR
mmetsp:Transcript_99944/g.288573  ORF Transcript_99944/g.288573 Transcript_99944/m.288573 type:complete len:212 (-) Transcript_99944:634-1269(-)